MLKRTKKKCENELSVSKNNIFKDMQQLIHSLDDYMLNLKSN